MNLGVNKQSTDPVADYLRGVEALGPLADYLVINVSSPNTPGLRELQQPDILRDLLSRLVRRRQSLVAETGRPVPLLVKVSPDLAEGELEQTVEVAVGSGLDGIIATNTTTSRDGLQSTHRSVAGGLSGAALTERGTRLVHAIAQRTNGRLPIVACGGVMAPRDARARLDAGARLVQLYTGLVYEGPGLVKRIVEGL